MFVNVNFLSLIILPLCGQLVKLQMCFNLLLTIRYADSTWKMYKLVLKCMYYFKPEAV